MHFGRLLPAFLAFRPLYWLALLAALLLARPGVAQHHYARTRIQPDTTLMRQARQLRQHFTEAGWTALAAELAAKPGPIYAYLNMGAGPGVQLLPVAIDRSQIGRQLPQRRSSHQFYRHLRRLNLQRRQEDYARLRAVLLTKATKVRRIEKALPVLAFDMDSAGRVRDVGVDPKRSHMGLTARSRKIILTALRTESFQAREVRYQFRQPRPFQEWRQRARRRVGRTSYKAFGWLAYKKVKRRGRCATIWYEEVPRIRFRRWGQ